MANAVTENLIKTFKRRIDLALKMFGEYTFSDKGPREVMDIDECVRDLEPLSMEEAASVLRGCLDHLQGKRFVGEMLYALQDISDEDFNVLMKYDDLAREY